jgi:hypothetical protein
VTDGAIRPDAEVRPQLELVDGIACHVMQLKDGSARVWLAQQLGTLPLRFERTIDNETCMRLNVIQFASVLTDTGNFWYPVKATIEQGTTYIGKIVSEVDVKEFVLNPVIPPDAFKIKFPDGTRVYDENLGLVYTTHSAGHDPHSPIVVLHDGAKPEVLSDLPTEATAGVTGNSIAQATAPKLSDTSDGADGNKASDPVAVTKFSHVKSLLIIGALCVFGLIIVSCRQFSRRQAE